MSKKILIVDDQQDLMSVYQAVLERDGFEVTTLLGDGSVKAEEVDLEGYHMVLIDKVMPVQYQVLKDRCKNSNTPYLIVTGSPPDGEDEVNKIDVVGKLPELIKKRLGE